MAFDLMGQVNDVAGKHDVAIVESGKPCTASSTPACALLAIFNISHRSILLAEHG